MLRFRRESVREHGLFLVYMATLLWLLASCIYFADSAGEELDFTRPLLVFTAVFLGVYVALGRAFKDKVAGVPASPLPDEVVRKGLQLLFVLFAGVVVMHLTTLGYIPMVRAFQSVDDYEIARVRQEGYYTLAVWQRYASDYAIKGMGPILLVLSAHFRSRLHYPALLVGLFYTTSLFVKANSVYLLLPLVVYYVLTSRKWRALLVAALMATSVGVNWTSSSPPVRDDVADVVSTIIYNEPRKIGEAKQVSGSIPGHTIFASVRERLVIVPAQVTAQWYYQYERPEMREKGCGYRLLAKVLACDYVHIPTKLYAIYYPDLVRKRGLTGSLNSGSYIHDFANFGYAGVVLGALVFGGIFTILRVFCRGAAPLLALSLMPVLSLPEMPISTVLNSGGWIMILAVSVLVQYGGLLVGRQPVEAR